MRAPLMMSVEDYIFLSFIVWSSDTDQEMWSVWERGDEVCMYVSRSRTYHRRCISKREEMIWKKFREKNVWTLPDENYEDDGAGQQV